MPTVPLPEEPNLEQLRKQAKDLRRAWQAGEPAALALVADDGAKIRQSLSSRAETMRRRELAEIEGKAGAKSQSMLVAQMLLCAAFLVFLIYPAAMQIRAF